MEDEPWFEQAIISTHGLEVGPELRELLKTPAQRRHELGIDKYLTSQKQNTEKVQQKKRSRQLRKQLRAPLREATMDQIKELKDKGHSIDDIAAQCIRPSVGKGKYQTKKKLRNSIADKLLKASKAKAKAKAKSQKGAEEVCWSSSAESSIIISQPQ